MIWILLALVLVGSSLSLRRLPTTNLVKLILLWVAIFGIVFLVVRLATGMA
ncbi:hypothetical protein [Sphingobium nicotianae]|uniref:Uncharacterized protein n=1 Tax=Sphingobium nicotianae TaxID=2782607 RepID=A0A9X1AK32_9SPHN|nr:hypothetical protein [Sphingobium nicotianae]MBT2185663.1 hypothetical protein [Sphingobium nicotianae]